MKEKGEGKRKKKKTMDNHPSKINITHSPQGPSHLMPSAITT
jgi:hypothetical protein